MVLFISKIQDEESAPADPSPSPSNKEEDSQDTQNQAAPNSPPRGDVGSDDFAQTAADFSDPQGTGNMRLDDESEYPPLTVHND